MRRFCIVIVNYRTPDLVIEALRSLPGQIDASLDRVVVVDNASGDDSADRIERAIEENDWKEWAGVQRAETNGGFSSGNNIGIRSVEAQYYVLLNSDAYLQEGALEALLEAVDRYPRAGLIGAALEYPDGRPQACCFRYRTPTSEMLEAAETGPLSSLFSRYVVPLPSPDDFMEPQWVSFACVLIRRDVVGAIGLLDDAYFMYFEDIDYCRRAREASWHVLHCPDARVVHSPGGTSPVPKAVTHRSRAPGYYYLSRSRYFAKFYGRGGLWRANLLWLFGRFISLLREKIGRRPRHTFERAARDIWMNAWDPLEVSHPENPHPYPRGTRG